MDLEREKIVEIAVSLASVLIVLAMFYAIGATYNSDGIGSDGGLYLVGSIVLFVVLMAGAGLYLAFTISDPEVDDEETAEGSG